MSISLDRYLVAEELERRFHRDAADRLSDAIGSARIMLIGFFCSDATPEVDTNGDPLTLIGAEQAIHRAFEPLEILCDAFERKGRRA